MKNALLEMKHVTKRFPGVIALNDVSLKLCEGEILAICGENGAGKSTLMKVLSGSYCSSEYDGEIWVGGEQKNFSSVAVSKANGIEMVYQELNMMLDASVAENVFVGNLPTNGAFVDYQKLYADTQSILDQIGLNDVNPRQVVRWLNSGQTQMLAIMRALANNPKIIVLDEPTSALTDSETDLLMSFMENLRKRGVSCLFISHKLEEIFRMADRVVVMRDGAMVAEHDVDQVDYATLVQEMVGRRIENMYPEKTKEIGDVVLQVECLTVPHPTNGTKNIVDNIGFSLHKGEILGIGGLVGAGRSEILSAIFGQITKGVSIKLTIHGQQVHIRSPRDAIKAGLGYLTEERSRSGFVQVMSILWNLTLASLRDIPHRFFIDRKAETEKALPIFNALRVKAPSLHSQIIQLSGGNQQKVVLGKWLLKNPDILLVDEPTKGIDVGSKAEIYTILNDLTSQGVSIIMVSSDMPELVSMSDRCLVVANGHITAELTASELTQTNVMQAAIAQ